MLPVRCIKMKILTDEGWTHKHYRSNEILSLTGLLGQNKINLLGYDDYLCAMQQVVAEHLFYDEHYEVD